MVVRNIRLWWSCLILLILCSHLSHLQATDRSRNNNLTAKSFLRVSNLPNFVGFSYSLASQRPPSQRFIHFLKENVNINANFLPTYGSFRTTRAGVYFFTFSFQSRPTDNTIVALKINSDIIIKATSESGGLNQISQSTMTILQPGDVVQLEILQGKVYESGSQDSPSTTFSGWLISNSCCDDNNDFERTTFRPPTFRPPYFPPVTAAPPTYYPTTRPPYIYTTTPEQRPPFGRVPDNCCDALLVSAANSRALDTQQEKFGIFRLVKIDPVDGRAIFKHCVNDVYIYFHRAARSGWAGWIIGPSVGVGRGGIILRSESMCVEKDFTNTWEYFDTNDFRRDSSITVSCYVEGRSDHGRDGNSFHDGDGKYNHFHHHEHYHHGQTRGGLGNNYQHQARSLSPPGPGYKIESNQDFIEATFVFPNRNDSVVYPSTTLLGLGPGTSGDALVGSLTAAEVLEIGRNGKISKRENAEKDELVVKENTNVV